MRVLIRANPDEARGKPYHWNLGEAISQAFGAIFGLNANLTFSAYCGYWLQENRPFLKHLHKFVNLLFNDSNHCQNAWKNMT